MGGDDKSKKVNDINIALGTNERGRVGNTYEDKVVQTHHGDGKRGPSSQKQAALPQLPQGARVGILIGTNEEGDVGNVYRARVDIIHGSSGQKPEKEETDSDDKPTKDDDNNNSSGNKPEEEKPDTDEEPEKEWSFAGGAMLPQEIIKSLEKGDGDAELKWRQMVDVVAKKGTFKDCIVLCDVSDGMDDLPMETAVALTILVSEASGRPWKGKAITFSENPTLQTISGKGFKEKLEFVRAMECESATSFAKVFDLLLDFAVNKKLNPETMVKRVFVFSDVNIDGASPSWEADREVIKKKFTDKGFGNVIPEIMFWNMSFTSENPSKSKVKGVATVDGYSKNLMALFLDNGKVI